jgi:hypothetical protein
VQHFFWCSVRISANDKPDSLRVTSRMSICTVTFVSISHPCRAAATIELNAPHSTRHFARANHVLPPKRVTYLGGNEAVTDRFFVCATIHPHPGKHIAGAIACLVPYVIAVRTSNMFRSSASGDQGPHANATWPSLSVLLISNACT